jgi:hypothetical protein
MVAATEQVRLFYKTLVRHFNEGKTSWGKNELLQELSVVYINFLENSALQNELKVDEYATLARKLNEAEAL